jgi:hypothetical protein
MYVISDVLLNLKSFCRLVTCGLANANMKTADPHDPRMIDIAGFDATVPSVINRFILDEC